MPARRYVLLDRDGTVNVERHYIADPKLVELFPGTASALRDLRAHGFGLAVITNQAGVAHGYFEEESVMALHAHMRQMLAAQGAVIDDVRYCPHHPEARRERYRKACDWRKPGAGMILDIARHWPVDLGRSFLVGDKASDMQSASAAGLRGFLYESGRLDLLVADALRAMR